VSMSLLKKGHCKTTIYTIKVERWLSVLLLLEKLTYKETKTQCLYASRSCQPEMTYTPNNYIFHQLFYTLFLCFNQYLIIMCHYSCISFITKNTSIHCKQKNAQIMIQNQVSLVVGVFNWYMYKSNTPRVQSCTSSSKNCFY
jgi:hypothetical protein